MKEHSHAADRLVAFLLAVGVACLLTATVGRTQTPPLAPAPREVPARTLPVPDTVSQEMRGIAGAPLSATWDRLPKTLEEWKALSTPNPTANFQPLRDRFGVKAEPMVVNGVKAYMLTPNVIPPANRNRLLVHIHGGCFMGGGGEASANEGTSMAGYGHFKVLSIDYRRPPDFFYPAALDDIVAVWKGALKMADPKNMAIFGTSAGGGLTLSAVLRLKQEGLPLPGAIGPGTPMSDLTKTGDSFYTNFMVDNVLVSKDGRCQAMAEFYANGRDLKDPMLSPVYGDMRGFPPAILSTGTRDLYLSNTVRVHRKLRQAGVEAVLHVYEGQSHANYLRDSPEGQEAFQEIARFFDKHLGK